MSDDVVTRLRQLAGAMSEAKFPALEATAVQAADEIERLREERDTARRFCCELWAGAPCPRTFVIARDYADELGWDCFKEDTDGK